jgi:hypothetical protein
MEHSKVKNIFWNKLKVNELCVLYNDHLAYYEFTNNYLYLSGLERFNDIVNLSFDPDAK